MKLGIAGAGKIVKEVLPVLEKLEIEVLGIWARESSGEKLIELSGKYGIKQWYIDYEAMLRNKETDTIYVAVPNSLHYDFVKKALLAGKHVICEKPFTSNAKELKELCKIAKDKKRILLEAITNQYMESFLQISKVIKNGQLGRIRIVTANYSQYSSRYDDFCRGKILPAFDSDYSGGALMDINIYNIHFVTGLFGKPIKIEYTANIERETDTSGILLLEYPDFQCVCIGSKDCNCTSYVQIQGTEGTLSLTSPAFTCEGYEILNKNGEKRKYVFPQRIHRTEEEFVEFIRILDEMDYNVANKAIEHSLLVMDIIDQAKMSAHLEFRNDRK